MKTNLGFLNKAEVKNALNEEYKDSGKKVTDSAIDAVFQFFDYNNDKKLSVGGKPTPNPPSRFPS